MISLEKSITTVGVILVLSTNVTSQIKIDTTKSVDYLVQEILLGQGILAGNVSFKGAKHAIGYFEDQNKPVGIEKGLLLTSGNVFYSAGPNKSPRSGWASNLAGDEDLNSITTGKTHDASVLEFDFVTTSENLSFDFVFASEEYQEYVGSKFNDVFGFFLTGPNADHENLATLPDGKTPITINNVNHQKGEEYYVDNPYYNTTDPFIWDVRKRKVVKNKRFQEAESPAKYDIQFDGFTVVLTARFEVLPNEVYHIKMAVSDVSDGILDSGVFLKAGSFMSSGEQLVAIDKSFKKPDISRRGILLASEKELDVSLSEVPMEGNIAEVKNEDKRIDEEIPVLNVQFDFDKFLINSDQDPVILNVVHILNENPRLEVTVVGHTDNWGSDRYNQQLSKKRSEAVVHRLLTFGINSDRIKKHFFGESVPISSNDTVNGRALNRRVEFIINQPN